MQQRLELFVAGVQAAIAVLRVDGVEALSEPYQFVVWMKTSVELSVDDLVGRRATLELSSGVFALDRAQGADADDSVVLSETGVVRRVAGIVFSVETLPEPCAYRAALVCPLAMLALDRSMRIFQDQSSVEVVLEVLARHGIAVSARLLAVYERRDYCVQYRETDFHFVARLLEEEGISYHFEQRDGRPQMVLTDDPSAFLPLAGQSAIVFRPLDGLIQTTESIHSLREHRELRPSRVSLADRNPRRPLLELAAEDRSGSEDPGDVYDFFGKFGKSERARRLARVRREEIDASRHFLTVGSNSVRLSAGRVIRLVDHDDERLNGEHLVVRVEHTAIEPSFHDDAPSHYANTVTLLALGDGRERAFRPARATPRPVALGVHTATVDGQGQPIRTDELGRVRVRFHWDREGRRSYWIRVSEGWAGLGYGTMFLPRDGQEVLVSFLEGDPDHPIIVGRVYNATQPLPDALQTPTVSVVRTATVGGDGYNELRFDDRAGEELVGIRGERCIHVHAGEHIALVVGDTRLEIRPDGVRINGEKVCTRGEHG